MVDEWTNLEFTKFFSKKNVMIEPTLKQIEKWKNNGLYFKHILLYNDGKNKKLQ